MHSCYLIYHPERKKTKIGTHIVHHDEFGGNEDPYIWNDRFLHTYCHITQLSNVEGQINFWISGNAWPSFDALYCDCVFVVEKKVEWRNANTMRRADPIVDSDEAYEHHYKWGDKKYGHHQLKRRRRYTLKADPNRSFQPQDGKGNLIDVLPFLNSQGITTEHLRKMMNTGRGSRPFRLEENIGTKLYDYLKGTARVKLRGKQLAGKHPNGASGSLSGSCC